MWFLFILLLSYSNNVPFVYLTLSSIIDVRIYVYVYIIHVSAGTQCLICYKYLLDFYLCFDLSNLSCHAKIYLFLCSLVSNIFLLLHLDFELHIIF